jgi:pimeloyl-ACP methyl ester carboxylesterase
MVEWRTDGWPARCQSFNHTRLRLHDDISLSELVIEPGVGHMAHYADPDKLEAQGSAA